MHIKNLGLAKSTKKEWTSFFAVSNQTILLYLDDPLRTLKIVHREVWQQAAQILQDRTKLTGTMSKRSSSTSTLSRSSWEPAFNLLWALLHRKDSSNDTEQTTKRCLSLQNYPTRKLRTARRKKDNKIESTMQEITNTQNSFFKGIKYRKFILLKQAVLISKFSDGGRGDWKKKPVMRDLKNWQWRVAIYPSG